MSGTRRAGPERMTSGQLVRNLWLARVAVSAWVQVLVPQIDVPDPTEHLVTMMREFVEARGAKFLVGVQSRAHDPRIAPFLDAQKIPNAAFDGAETFDDFGYHWTPKGQAFVAGALLGRNRFRGRPVAGGHSPPAVGRQCVVFLTRPSEK